MLELAFLLPSRGKFQGIPSRVTNDKQSVGFEQRGQDGIVQKLLGERGGAAADILLAVGRVGDDEVESASCGG
jgi:hypothetical protein